MTVDVGTHRLLCEAPCPRLGVLSRVSQEKVICKSAGSMDAAALDCGHDVTNLPKLRPP